MYDPAAQIAAAQRDLGYREYGNNCQQYSAWQSGITCQQGGWCVSAASKWAYDGGFRFGPDATFGDKGFNGTWALEAWARKHWLNRTPAGYRAQPGDLFCVRGAIHTATVVVDRGPEVEARGIPRFITIDGNTSNQVAYRTRYSSTCEMIVALTSRADVKSPTTAQIVAQQPKTTIAEESVPIIVKEKATAGEYVTAEVVNGVLFVTGQKANPFREGKQGDMAPWPYDKTGTTFVCDLKPFMPEGTILKGFPATEHAPDGPGSWVIMSLEPAGAKHVVRKKTLHRA